MLQLLATEVGKVALIIALPILGGVVTELVRTIGNELLEDANPGIQILRQNMRTIDFAMKISNPELLAQIKANPVAAFAREILAVEHPTLAADQVERALAWAASKFDYSIHERFNPDLMRPEQRVVCDRLVSIVQERIESLR
jgi:hypothetical protein